MSHTHPYPGLALAAALLLLLASLPGASALHGAPDVVVCGTVRNAAGWPLAEVTVSAVGAGVLSVDHVPPLQVRTDADGRFSFTVARDRYVVAFADLAGPVPRAGAVYASTQLVVQGNQYVPGACNAARGVALAPVTLLAPGVGFVEAQVRDGAAGPAAPLPGADAAVVLPAPAEPGAPAPTLGALHTWGAAPTDAAGVARLTCPLAAPVAVTVAKDDFDAAASATFPCEDRVHLTLAAWRTAVPVAGTVRDADTDAPLAGAAVAATLRALPLSAGHPYTLQATSGADGAYALGLPWGDTADLVASGAGYAPRGGVQDLVAGQAPDRDFALPRQAFPVGGTVTDALGAALPGATVSFQGPSPLTDLVEATSGADGGFALPLRHGAYDVTVDAQDKATRTCVLTVGTAGAASFPAGCLQLFRPGHGAVRGTVRDALGAAPLAGADVEAGAGGPSTTTGPDGAFLFEAPEGPTELHVSEPGFDPRTLTLTVPLAGTADAGALDVQRRKVPLHVAATDDGQSNTGVAPGTAVAGAEVCVERVRADGAPEDRACTPAGADGAATFEVAWSARPGSPDIGDYRVDAMRLDAAPLYARMVCALADVGPEGASLPCALRAVDGVRTPVGPLHDAHTGASVGGVAVTAVPDSGVCAAPYRCDAATLPDGTAELFLPKGRSFTVGLADPRYQVPADLPGHAPGAPVHPDLALARAAADLEVEALDVHTGAPVEAVALAATAPFACDPGHGGFACAATTAADGTATLRLPWGAFEVAAAAGAYTVQLGGDGAEPDVRFERAARAGVEVPMPAAPAASDDAGDAGPDAVLEPSLRLLRAPGAAVTGTLRDHDGQPTGAQLRPASERDGFTCDPEPADHDGPALRFPGCHPGPAAGAYARLLPDGNHSSHTWTLEAAKPGHFTETRHGVGLGDAVDFTLWPLAFDLVVEPRDALTSAPVRDATVCILNLDQAQQALPVLPQFRCATNDAAGSPIVFPGVTWIRADLDGDGDLTGPDEGDLFLVRGAQAQYVGAFVGELGPGEARLVLTMAPLDPQADPNDGDGDGFPGSLETVLGTDPADPTSHPLNAGLAYHDLNDGHSVFITAEGAAVGADGAVHVAPAHGQYGFVFEAERYPVHVLAPAEPVPLTPGTPVAFALLDASFAARAAASAGAGTPLQPWRDQAFYYVEGVVGDANFPSIDGLRARVQVPADALPTLADAVVPWAWVRAGDVVETPLGPMQAASGYHSLARNALQGTAAADKLDYAMTPVLLAAASLVDCNPVLAGDTVTMGCGADSAEGFLGADAAVRINIGSGIVGATLATDDGLPTEPLGVRRVGVEARAGDPARSLGTLLDTDGDGTGTLDEALAGRDPTMAGDDAGFPQNLVDASVAYLEARLAEGLAWLGL